ncbi:MAG: sugar phosphate isomerase/epimerase [Clostridium sp.]|jgi:sugar phosphate isomerase/epimerase|nr:sugar phosphate isomerase/epimerase [Clostridium sp.]
MNNGSKNQFKLCAFADEAGNTLTEQIAALQGNGIGLLEIRGVDEGNISAITVPIAKRIRERLDEAGIGVWSIGSPSGKIQITDDFAPHLENFKRQIEFANVLGAKHYRMFSFYGCEAASPGVRDEVMERLGGFLHAAAGSGVILCHENEKGIYGEMAAGCLDIHKTLPQMRAVFDPANFIQAEQDVLEAWEMLSPYIEYMHIKDARANGEVVPAGEGIGHVDELLRKFMELGGSVLTLEPHLAVFEGLEKLEGEARSKIGSNVYPSKRAAFDAASNALKTLLDRI